MTTEPSTQSGTQSGTQSASEHPHDFEVQKQVHQQIRNDPDYDDWEYGTEPLPREAWVSAAPSPSVSPSSGA